MEEIFSAVRKDSKSICGPSLEGTLISTDNMDAIQRAIRRMKVIPGKRFGFECTLDSKIKRGDFSLSITRELGEQALNNSIPVEDWFKEANSKAEWRRTVNFIKQWLDKSSLLYYCINTIYLELDVGDSSGQSTVPGIFFRLANSNNNIRWYPAMTFAALSALGIEISQERKELIREYFEKFFTAARVFQVGVMFSRKDYPMKLVALNVPVSRIKEVLSNWKSNTLEYLSREEWQWISDHTSGFVGVSLDITDKIEKRIGIEIPVSRQQNREKWEKFHNWLIEKDYCALDKYAAVLNWIGSSGFQPSGSEDMGQIDRKISHLKLVLAPDRQVHAKIYLEYAVG